VTDFVVGSTPKTQNTPFTTHNLLSNIFLHQKPTRFVSRVNTALNANASTVRQSFSHKTIFDMLADEDRVAK
jgi:hypothetical protein